jgi:hypothetical protein
MDPTRLVTIRSYANEVDASMALQHLETHGIEAHIRTDDCGGMQSWLQGTQGVFLEVLDKDENTANEILDAMNE